MFHGFSKTSDSIAYKVVMMMALHMQSRNFYQVFPFMFTVVICVVTCSYYATRSDIMSKSGSEK